MGGLRMLTRLLLLACLVMAFASPAAAGQAAVEPCLQKEPVETAPEVPVSGDVIQVTGSRCKERLVDAPVTMTIIGEEAIANAPVQSATELLRLVPGVNIARTSARDINITSRG